MQKAPVTTEQIYDLNPADGGMPHNLKNLSYTETRTDPEVCGNEPRD